MKRLILLVSLLTCLPAAHAQYGALTGFCEMGGVSALIQGLQSTNKLQGVVPSCTVTVYLTGTQVKPPNIYSDGSGTVMDNPLTAGALSSNAPGQWLFYAATGQAYDVVLSGGIPPNVYRQPVTLVGLPVGIGGGGGGGSSSPPQFSIQFAANGSGAFGSDPSIFINPTQHILQTPELYVPGSGTGLIGIIGSASQNQVTQTVQDSTGSWTYYWPPAYPQSGTGPNCLTVTPAGIGGFIPCTSSFNVYDIRSYGAVSGASDVTSAVQQAVNAASGAGGVVYIPSGIWNINGAINGACDAIICMPVIQPTSGAQQVKIEGVTRNRQDAQGPNNLTGSVIQSSTLGTDVSSAVFGVQQVTAPFGNNLDVYFSDLTIRTYPNPQIGCIDMYYAAGASIDGVRCEVGENYTATHTQPTHVATGITLPRTGNDTLSFLTRSEITGYYQGANISEHAYLNDTWVAFGIQGYFIEPSYNPITGHMGCEEVATCWLTQGGAQLDVNLAIELDPMNVFGCASWCYSTTDISDEHNVLNGLVRYYKSEANVGNITTPIAIDTGGFSTPAAIYYNTYTNQYNKLLAPIFTSTGTMPTCVGGTGVTCTVSAGSTEARGGVSLTLTSVTIDTPLVTINFGQPLAGPPWCYYEQDGGSAFYGLYIGGSPTINSFNINNAVSLTGITTLTIGYQCSL